jgi:hypothetical protein
MNRTYNSGNKSDVTFFTGDEIEQTPAFGESTLFVVGLHSADDIKDLIKSKLTHYNISISHIYFGANQSYMPSSNADDAAWEDMIFPLLESGYLCTLDFDAKFVSNIVASKLVEHNNFIPQISLKIPFINLLNYNTCIKIDDIGFNATNPGVWVHQLHDLMSRTKFTPWSKYSSDEIIK